MPTWLTAIFPLLLQAIEGLLSEAQASNAAANHPKTANVLGVINQITAIVGSSVIASSHPVATPGGGQGAAITPPK
jgi:hypothetical protein